MATVGSFGIDLGLNTARFEEGLKRAGTGADRFQRTFKSAMSGLATISGVAAAGAAGLFAATKSALDYAGAIGDAAERTGLARESFQELRFAAEQSGIQAEVFESAMSRLTVTIGAAATGSKAQAEMFARLGISVRDAGGNVRGTEAVLRDLADAISAVDSPAEQARIATEAMGRAAGPQLAVMLRQGSEGLNELQAAAQASGAVISDQLIRQAEAAGDKLDAMSTVVRAQLTSALVELTPVITSVAQSFANAAPHVARFFNILRGGNLDAIAGQMGTVRAEIDRLRASQESANATVEKNMFGRLIADAEKRLRELQDQYGLLMRQTRAAGPADAPAIVPGVDTGGGGARSPAAAAARTVAAAEEVGAEAGQAAGTAYMRELAVAIDTSTKWETATLDKFAQMQEAAAQAANDWAEQSEVAAGRIADSLEFVVFAGFQDGVKGMRNAFNQVLQQMILDLARSKLRETLTSLFQGAGSGGGSGFGSLLGAVVGAFGGGGGKGAAAGGLKGFAQGGSFTVPGPSTGDNVIPLFRANGGETVTVTPRGGGSGVTIVNNNDFRGADRSSEARMVQAMRENNEYVKRQVADLLRRNRL